MENFSEHFGAYKSSYRAAYLISSFLHKDLSEEEREELDQWIMADDRNMELFEQLTDETKVDDFLRWYSSLDTEVRLAAVKDKLFPSRKARVRSILKWAAAACAIGILGFGVYYFIGSRSNRVVELIAIKSNDVAPGGMLATLKFDDGRVVELRGDTVINERVKIVNGVVVYDHSIEGATTVQEHEVIVPRKGFYSVVLSDGTKVYLNSESSITYPSSFTGATREVRVTGESYFEVAKDASHPFIVSVNDVKVQALGTAFNILAYADEPGLRTTLVEGSVKVSSENNSTILRPGEQSLLKDGKFNLSTVDVIPITAWTSNEFRFQDVPLEIILRAAARWYDVEIQNPAKINYRFTGFVRKSEPLSKLLSLLEKTTLVKFKIDGRNLIVSK